MPNFEAFTLKPGGLISVLQTHCLVAIAHNHNQAGAQFPYLQFTGLWDTGATNSVITLDVVTQLGLAPVGQTTCYHAQGHTIANQYLINIGLPNSVGFSHVLVTEGILSGTDLLIGMDIISQGDFSITNFGGNTCFSFRYPSVKEVDFVAEHHTQSHTPVISGKIGRNSLCSCGSGKKYKHCHGK